MYYLNTYIHTHAHTLIYYNILIRRKIVFLNKTDFKEYFFFCSSLFKMTSLYLNVSHCVKRFTYDSHNSFPYVTSEIWLLLKMQEDIRNKIIKKNIISFIHTRTHIDIKIYVTKNYEYKKKFRRKEIFNNYLCSYSCIIFLLCLYDSHRIM